MTSSLDQNTVYTSSAHAPHTDPSRPDAYRAAGNEVHHTEPSHMRSCGMQNLASHAATSAGELAKHVTFRPGLGKPRQLPSAKPKPSPCVV
jgi:hypothetical protein